MLIVSLLQEILIPIGGGIYAILMGLRLTPKQPKNPEAFEIWYSKYGKLCLWGGIIIVTMTIIRIIWVILRAI